MLNKRKNKPLLTVYITNYNYAKFIKQSIDSVLRQTFKDFELIIIDDGSTDNSRDIILEYENEKNVYTVFQKNQGLNKTNNNALKIANGKYIVRLDADDFLAPQALELMVNELERNPEFVMIFPDYYLVDENGTVLDQVRRHDFKRDVTLMDLPAHGACTVIRTDVLKKIGGYDESFKCQDGYDIWLKIISKYNVNNISLPLFYYRQHGASLTKNEKTILKTRAQIKEKHIKKKNNSSPNVLVIIPVRGASTHPKSISLEKLHKKPLIDWTIDSALESKTVSDILISTPDNAIIEHVKHKYEDNVIVMDRQKELARINTPLEPTVSEAIKYYSHIKTKPDLVVLLFIESPFRSAFYIDKAVHTQQIFDTDVVDGIREEDDIFYYHNGDGLRPWNINSGLRLERDNLFRRSGGIHLIQREFFERERNILSGKIGHITLDQRSAFTIRTEMDWKIAQYLALEEQK
ncbi:glycosyltransferase [uncultured Desulfobacter sp.]|uniref:glycosyltransferase n=1 Tax=uncultured Desulfobacter sp. TaxID=240139 RepID=UPI002AA8C168|nr:glycosyltransferase [uncultured Desulfobacter sp.]